MSLARAFSALTGASLVTMLTQLLRGKLAALLLGPAGVGVFNQLSLLFNLATVAGQLGAFQGIVRHGADALAAEDRLALRRLAATSTLLLGSMSLLIAAAGVIFSRELSDHLLHDRGANADLVALILLAVPFAVTSQIYRALLSGARAVGRLVRTQILSDLGALLVFATLIFPLGLRGAVLGFMASHFLLFLTGALALRRELGRGLIRPLPGLFTVKVVRKNAGFGAAGMFMIGTNNLSVLLVSSMVIAALGVAANGIFANGWRIASVYLGAVTATTISYFLPTLTKATDDAARSAETNKSLRFYLLLLPPLMAGVMIGGELLVWLILSRDFLAVAGLLLLFVPAELLRIMAETTSTALLARKKLLVNSSLFLCQAASFVIGAWLLLPAFGIAGAAGAYLLSMLLYLVLMMPVARHVAGIEVERGTAFAFARALLLLAGCALVALLLPFGLLRVVGGGMLVAAWLALALLDRSFADELRSVLAKVRLGPRGA